MQVFIQHRSLCKLNVVSFINENYNSIIIIYNAKTGVRNCDGSRYICRNCNTNLIKNKVTCQEFIIV